MTTFHARPRVAPLLLALTLAAASACRRARPAGAPTPTAGANDQARLDSIARARTRDSLDAAQRARALRDSAALADAQRAARAGRGARDSAVTSARAVLVVPVYFDYDQSELRDDTRAALEAKLAILARYPALRVRVAGHTDDRGADEYNLALGGRRAAAVKRYFAERGVDADRIDVVSFGKERPTCEAEDESCWGRNRRAEFAVVRGGETLGSAP
ncbi:hypothetical protein tb265_35810 [Gemmatimonadetes bacterium T265]|nr:hypothetical protein tb265_35810 [Gemmatimonadetes bacterium T265]